MLRHERTFGVGKYILVAAVMAAPLMGSAAWASDWPQWRGPNVDGIAADAMTGTTLTVAWTKDVGLGYAAATVVGDRIYTAGWAGGKDTIWCLNANDGGVAWQYSYPCARHNNMHEGGPAATPAVDAGRVYTLSRDGQLHCLDAKDGQLVWKKELKREFGVSEPDWAFSGSPVVNGNLLLIDVGKIIALNKTTGQTIWQTDDFGAAYSTPVPFDHQGKQYLATFPRAGLVILDAKTGKHIATHGWRTDYGVNAATPIVKGNRIFVTSGYNTGCAMLEFNGQSLRLVWENREMRGQMATPVLIGNYLYGFDDRQLKCVDFATGKSMWDRSVERQVRPFDQGALSAAGGKLVIQTEDGQIVLGEGSPQGFKELGRVQAFNGRRSWVMPVVANGRVYARSPNGPLAAIDVK